MPRQINYDQSFLPKGDAVYIPDSVLLDEKRSLDGNAWKVFYTFCYFDQHKQSEPTLAELQAATNLTENTVIAKIKLLESLEYLTETNPRQHLSETLRWEVFERDNFTCQLCGSRRCLTVDHIKPRKLGGTHAKSNLRTLCRSCNSKKGAKF